MTAPPRILVVDDSELPRRMAVRMLERLGCAPDAVATGEEALASLRAGGYEAIFLDCEMPGMSGFEVSRHVREMEAGNRHTPIVAMTGHLRRDTWNACRDAGMDDYVGKPLTFEELDQALWRVVDRKGPLRSARIEQGELNGGDEEPGSTALLEPALLSDVLGDNPAGERLISAFEAEVAAGIVRLRRAIADGDEEAMRREAHELRGAAATVGARRLQSVCERFDHAHVRNRDAMTHLQEQLDLAHDQTRVALGDRARTA